MKPLRRLLVVFCMIIILLTPKVVLAEENNEQSSTIQPRGNSSVTVTDSEKNRYYVSGSSIRTGKHARVITSFSVSYYYGGTEDDKSRVDGYKKSITAKAEVGLLGGGNDTLGGITSKTGSSGDYSPAVEYIYTVVAVAATHGFSCNGGNISFFTTA